MITLAIKKTAPYTEKVIQASLNGVDLVDNITIGVKAYSEDILTSMRQEYSTVLGDIKILRLLNQLKELPENLSLSDKEFISEQNRINSELASIKEAHTAYQEKFVRDNVLFIKNISLEVTDNNKTSKVLVDTRDEKVLESLNMRLEDGLAVLLDLYLKEPMFRDSILTIVPKLVFNTDFEEKKVKN
jgi:hypothetical protein